MLCPFQGRQGACKLARLISPILWSTLSVWSFGNPVSDFFHGLMVWYIVAQEAHPLGLKQACSHPSRASTPLSTIISQ